MVIMKKINRICALNVVLMIHCVLLAAVSDADEPDIAALKRAIPVLSPDNEDLNSFYFIGESVIPFGAPTAFEVCWTRDSGFGFVLVDQFGYPLALIAERQLLLYDASQSEVFLGKDFLPNVIIKSKDRNLTATVGFKGNKNDEAEFVVDMLSLVSTTKRAPEPDLSRVNETDWKLTYAFDTGADVIYLFRVDQEIAFKSAVLSLKQQPFIKVRDVVINQRVPERLMKFPDTAGLTAEITVEELPEKPSADIGKTLGELAGFLYFSARALGAPAAIQDPSLRELPIFKSDIDWEEVEKNHKRIGAKLKDFLKVDIKDRVVLPLK